MLCKGDLLLRAVEPEDIEYLYKWENCGEFWGVSGTMTPFSRYTLEAFIQSQSVDIHTSKQLRLMVVLQGETIGMVDVFDFEPFHLRASLGIFISPEYQGQGWGREAVDAVCEYCCNTLGVRQLAASCAVGNLASISLFKSCGFTQIGVRESWVRVDADTFVDEVLFQKMGR